MTYKKFIIKNNSSIKKTLKQMSIIGEKCLIVENEMNKFLGTISDGDLRKAILKNYNIKVSINKIYNQKPIILQKNYLINDAKKKFLKYKLDIIPVLYKNKLVQVLTWNEFFSEKKKNIDTPVVIMAGGLGTRLAPFTTVLPKPLIPINGKPVIEHIIERFFENGFRKFYITLNYKSKILKAFFNEFKKYKKVKFIEEKKPLGTAGSLSFFKKKNYNNIIVINCDSLINLNYANYLKYHIESNNDMTLVGCKMSYAFPYGICKFKENNTLLSEIEEKKKYNFFVNTGLYILKSKLVSFKKNTKIDMNEFISILISKGKNIGIYPIDENSWKDVGQWNDYNKIKDKSNLN